MASPAPEQFLVLTQGTVTSDTPSRILIHTRIGEDLQGRPRFKGPQGSLYTVYTTAEGKQRKVYDNTRHPKKKKVKETIDGEGSGSGSGPVADAEPKKTKKRKSDTSSDGDENMTPRQRKRARKLTKTGDATSPAIN